jgi:hypothetical protein
VLKHRFFDFSLIFILFSLFFLNYPFSFAQESLTITTYYPSPYGSYNQLQTNTLGVGDNDGDGGLDSGDVPSTAGDVWVAGKVGIGTMSPAAKLDVQGGDIQVGHFPGQPGLRLATWKTEQLDSIAIQYQIRDIPITGVCGFIWVRVQHRLLRQHL